MWLAVCGYQSCVTMCMFLFFAGTDISYLQQSKLHCGKLGKCVKWQIISIFVRQLFLVLGTCQNNYNRKINS